MISENTQIRVRYDEVDQMGYVYHANYVKYCHMARTETMRQYHLHDQLLEEQSILLPVIEMNLKYYKPGKYDDLLNIKTSIPEIPKTRFIFKFEIRNEKDELICEATSTVVFVNSETRKPMKAPEFIINVLSINTKATV